MVMRVGRGDEALEQRMRLVGFALKFRVKLAGDEEGVIGQLDDFHQLAVWREAAEHKLGLLKALTVGVIKLVPVSVAFLDHKSAVQPGGFGAHDQLAGLGAKAHGAPLFVTRVCSSSMAMTGCGVLGSNSVEW